MANWFTNQPLWMPEGSVRALLALLIVGTFVAGLHEHKDIALAAIAFYFGARK